MEHSSTFESFFFFEFYFKHQELCTKCFFKFSIQLYIFSVEYTFFFPTIKIPTCRTYAVSQTGCNFSQAVQIVVQQVCSVLQVDTPHALHTSSGVQVHAKCVMRHHLHCFSSASSSFRAHISFLEGFETLAMAPLMETSHYKSALNKCHSSDFHLYTQLSASQWPK